LGLILEVGLMERFGWVILEQILGVDWWEILILGRMGVMFMGKKHRLVLRLTMGHLYIGQVIKQIMEQIMEQQQRIKLQLVKLQQVG
jgi:hypothetical protein